MSDYFIKPNRQNCPKCVGIISVRQDHYGKYLVCYICGKNIHPRDLPITPISNYWRPDRPMSQLPQPQKTQEPDYPIVNPDIPADAVRQFMNLKLQKPLQQIFNQPLTITTEPNGSLTITARNGKTPVLRIQPEESAIRIQGNNDDRSEFDPGSLIIARDPIPMPPLKRYIEKSIRKATIKEARKLTLQQWQLLSRPNARIPHPDAIRKAVGEYRSTLPPSMQFYSQPEPVIRQIHEALRKLIDPEILKLAETFRLYPQRGLSAHTGRFLETSIMFSMGIIPLAPGDSLYHQHAESPHQRREIPLLLPTGKSHFKTPTRAGEFCRPLVAQKSSTGNHTSAEKDSKIRYSLPSGTGKYPGCI